MGVVMPTERLKNATNVTQDSANISQLPTEILFTILEPLPPPVLQQCAQLSRRFNRLSVLAMLGLHGHPLSQGTFTTISIEAKWNSEDCPLSALLFSIHLHEIKSLAVSFFTLSSYTDTFRPLKRCLRLIERFPEPCGNSSTPSHNPVVKAGGKMKNRIEEIELGFGTHATPFQITWPRMFVGDTRMKVTEQLFKAVVRKVRRRFGVYYIPRPAPNGVSLHALNGFTIIAGTMEGTRAGTNLTGIASTACRWKRRGLKLTKNLLERSGCRRRNPKVNWVELGETYLLKAPGFAEWLLQEVAASSRLRKFSIAAHDLRRTFPNTHQAILASVSDVLRDHLAHLIVNGVNGASDLQCLIPFVAGLKKLKRLEIWSEDSASAGPQPFARPSDFVGVEVGKKNLEARSLRHLDARMEILLYLAELARGLNLKDPSRLSNDIGLPKLRTMKIRYDIDAMHKPFDREQLVSSLAEIEQAFGKGKGDWKIEMTLTVRGRNLTKIRSQSAINRGGLVLAESTAKLGNAVHRQIENVEWMVYGGEWDRLQAGELDARVLEALGTFPNLRQVHFLPAYQVPLPNKPLDCFDLRERLLERCPKLERVLITKA